MARIHGTRSVKDVQHPVFNLNYWKRLCPLGDNRRSAGDVYSPAKLAYIEQARSLAKPRGEAVPVDVFVWASGHDHDRPWLTRLGGYPWRAADAPWPRDKDGVPLCFLGQVCFVDSMDVVAGRLPGDVVLLFGRYSGGWVYDDPVVVEWSPLRIKKPADIDSTPWNAMLPLALQGVRHRTVQYTDHKKYEGAFHRAGFEHGGWNIASIQATSIGTYCSLPQVWPFHEEDRESLVCTLSSFYCWGEWPLCDMPSAPKTVDVDGTPDLDFSITKPFEFGIGDAGAMWVYRDGKSGFKCDGACG